MAVDVDKEIKNMIEKRGEIEYFDHHIIHRRVKTSSINRILNYIKTLGIEKPQIEALFSHKCVNIEDLEDIYEFIKVGSIKEAQKIWESQLNPYYDDPIQYAYWEVPGGVLVISFELYDYIVTSKYGQYKEYWEYWEDDEYDND